MRKNNAFTLIELLVVIAIISLLVSILLPSLNKAKALARTVVCSVNLKNIGLSMMLYREDNDAFNVPLYCPQWGRGESPVTQNSSYWYWSDLLFSYAGEDKKAFDCSCRSDIKDIPDNFVSYGLNQTAIGPDPDPWGRGYSGLSMGWDSREYLLEITSTRPDSAIEEPANFIAFSDGINNAGPYTAAYPSDSSEFADPFPDIAWQSNVWYVNQTAFWSTDRVPRIHDGKSNYLFYDGHCETAENMEYRSWTIQKD